MNNKTKNTVGKITPATIFVVLLIISISVIFAPLLFLKPSLNTNSALPTPQAERIKLAGAPINNNFQATQTPEIRIKTPLSSEELKKRIIFRDSAGKIVNLNFEIKEENEIKIISILPSAEFKPGKYTLEIEKITGINFSQDFTWGVLAINTNKSSYLPDEEAEIYMTVLDNLGKTACNAEVNLAITSPKGEKFLFSTENGSIFKSPECQPKNFTYKPDFKAIFKIPKEEGKYQLYLESKIEKETRQISSLLLVSSNQPFVISRQGPIRLYPPSTYEMKIKILARQDFNGLIEESVPASFEIFEINASEEKENKIKKISWPAKIEKGQEATLAYKFKAPNISPEFYLLGPIKIIENSKIVFEEPTSWQLAADATANLILFFDGSTIPNGWTCISCSSGNDFYQVFPRGEASYGTSTGGAESHSHTFSGNSGGPLGCIYNVGGAGTSGITNNHTHSVSGTTSAASNNPVYRELKIIKYNSGVPAQIPSGAIAIFDTTVPSGFTRYSSQDNYFIRGSGSAGTTGGSNSHSHTVSVTFSASSSCAVGGDDYQLTFPVCNHTHSGSGTTANADNIPPSITVILGKANSDTNIPWNALIGLLDSSTDSQWTILSQSGGAFYQKFLLGSSTYGNTTSTASHTHSNLTVTSGIQSSSSYMWFENVAQNAGCGNHSHSVTLSFGYANHLPVYRNVVIGKFTNPSPPTNCSVSGNDNNPTLTVNWTDSTPGEDSFEIYRSVNGGAFSYLNSVSANSTSYIDETTSYGNTYAYKIRGKQGSNYTDYCTTQTYVYSLDMKFEGVKIEGIKINYLFKKKILSFLEKIFFALKSILQKTVYAVF